MSEMNHGLFVLVLNSLYNTAQFTFFLSFSLSLSFLPGLSFQDSSCSIQHWVSPFLTGLSSSCFPSPTRFISCWSSQHGGVDIFLPLFSTFSHMLTQQWLSSGSSCCARGIFMSFRTRVRLQSPPTPTQTWCRVTSRVSCKRESDPFVRHMLPRFCAHTLHHP